MLLEAIYRGIGALVVVAGIYLTAQMWPASAITLMEASACASQQLDEIAAGVTGSAIRDCPQNLPPAVREAQIHASLTTGGVMMLGAAFFFWMATMLAHGRVTSDKVSLLVDLEYKRRADASKAKATPPTTRVAPSTPH